MSYHWIYSIGGKACTWSAAALEHVWPQSPCNVEETWSMGLVIVGVFAGLALFAVIRRIDAWHNYYRR